MNRKRFVAAATILLAAYRIIANPALAEPQEGNLAACMGDYICADPAIAVSAWPLERWSQVPRAASRSAPRADHFVRKVTPSRH